MESKVTGFAISDKTNLWILSFDGTTMTSEKYAEATKQASELISLKYEKNFALDLGEENRQSAYFLRFVAALGAALKKNKKKLMFMGVNETMARYLKGSGLEYELPPKPKPEPEAPAKAAPKFDVTFINPFIEGAVNTLAVQCSFKAVSGKPFLKGTTPLPTVDLAAVIGITSKAFNGSMAICFPEKIFLILMSNMLGEKYEKITKDLEDGAAELLNVIFGHAKRILNEKGYGIEKAIPTIVSGKSLEVQHLTRKPTIILPFESESGSFYIEVATEAAPMGLVEAA